MSDRINNVGSEGESISEIAMTRPVIMGLLGVLLNAGFSLWLNQQYGIKHALVWWVATMLGFTFLRSGYGFTRAWRNLVVGHSTVGVRSHLLWVALASCLMFPVFHLGWFDAKPFDIMRPVGIMMASGAFIFAIGMQLAGSCTSGSMYRAGSGQFKLWLSILGIVIGAFFAALHYGYWSELPTYFVYSYQREFSWPIAIMIQMGIVIGLWLILYKLEKRWNGKVLSIFDNDNERCAMSTLAKRKDIKENSVSNWKCCLFGSWSLGAGSVVLAILSFLALILLNRPWVISLAFPFWSTKLTSLFGMEFGFEFWDYWGISQNESMLQMGLFEDVTSLMNIAFIFGATWATASAIKQFSNKSNSPQKLSIKQLLYLPSITFIGGLLMGYGAVIGLGCNIGGFIAAVLSGSVHGWVWVLAALIGTVVGTGLRKLLKV
ncbi:MAG: YeeE/YedE family protein [Arenicella sp.]